ncbi:AMP-binding protein [Patulibacter sp. S7RM1-6]
MLESSPPATAPRPLLAALSEAFADDPGRPAVVTADGPRSWRAIAQAAAATARQLAAGTGPVGVLDLEGVELLVVLLAGAAVGRATCTLHGDWSDAEVAAAMEDADVTEVFTSRAVLPREGLVRRPPAFGELSEPAGDVGASGPADDDPLFYIGFTSGSSGRPKPFTRRQRSWTGSFDGAAELFSLSRETTVVLAGSLQHSHFLFGAVLGWSQGAPVRLYERFDPERVARDVRDAGPSVVYLVPTMLAALERAGVAPMPAVRSVVVSGAKMEAHHWQRAARLFPEAAVAELYGASETSFITVNQRGLVDDDPGYVGMPFPGIELEIRPREGDTPGNGLVYLRSAFLFEGYLERGEVVRGVPTDGFATVGDIGTIRPDGALSLRGRASNLVITGGKNVHPEEVEIVLAADPTVAECAVVGAPHPYWGEELVAIVAAAPDATIDEQGLRAGLRGRVAAYKIPKRWILVERLPRLSTGKIDRRTVRQIAVPATAGSAPEDAER